MPIPCGHKILVSVHKAPEKKNGIYLPPEVLQRDQSKTGTATVIAVGPTAYKSKREYMGEEPWVKPGDKVYVSAYIGFQVYVKGETDKIFKFVDDEDIIGLVEEGDDIKNDGINKEDDF